MDGTRRLERGVTRRSSARRALLTVEALRRKYGVTRRELTVILGYQETTYGDSNSMKWIDAVGWHLAVVEIGKRRNEGCLFGPKAIVYGVQ